MPIVTVQLGQCGNQLGASWFDTVAQELSSSAYGQYAADAFFQEQCAAGPASSKLWTARAVMVDMEPKAINSARQAALSSSYGWHYSPNSIVSGQCGSGNNWALGHNKYGPDMAPAVLELVRQQAEACDTFEGFLMLQSMAGGTGAGAGTYLSESLVDEYGSAHMLNCCVWPYASGEVTVQPYNTLLTMSALNEVSTGILLLQNEVLHATCTRLMGMKHPGFKDLNAVAARAIASALLPSRARPAACATAATAGSGGGSSSTVTSPSRGMQAPMRFTSSSSAGGGSGLLRPSSAGQPPPQQQQQQQQQHCGGLTVGSPLLYSMADLACHLFSHPSYRLASIRCVPQLAAGSLDYTTFSWAALLRRLKAMAVAGAYLDEGLSQYSTASPAGLLPLHKYKNKAASSMLLLRGQDAATVNVSEFADPHWHMPWAVNPLLVAGHAAKFANCQMSATLLATDKACVAELRPMLAKAYSMCAARAYVQQYEAYGLGHADFQQCFAAVEDAIAAYEAL